MMMSGRRCDASDLKTDSSTVSAETDEISPYSNPVFHKISLMNGKVNQMTTEEVHDKTKQFKLDMLGGADILRKRLKEFYRNQLLMRAQISDAPYIKKCPYSLLCIIDFEATCEACNGVNYPHEIIEFPAILIDTTRLEIVDTFHEYVKPLANPILSDFCKELTGISQEVVNKADSFKQVLVRFDKWMGVHRSESGHSIVIVTDGPWDMGRFLSIQCFISDIPFPDFGKKWINIRKSFSNFYKTKRLSLANMLEILGMTFEGQPHCGYDDALNISRIVIQMLKDGCCINVNERINWNSFQKGRKMPADMSQAVIPVNTSHLLPKRKNNCYQTKRNKGEGKKVVNEAMELLSQLDVDPSVSGTEAILLQHKNSRNPFSLSK